MDRCVIFADSDDDQDVGELVAMPTCREVPPNPRLSYLKDNGNPLELYSEYDFKIRYRISKRVFINHLMPLAPKDNPYRKSMPLPLVINMTIALRYYATGHMSTVISELPNITRASCWRIVNRISVHLAKIVKYLVKFPKNEADYNKNKDLFYKYAKFPEIIGCLGYHHIPIKCTDIEKNDLYKNKDEFQSLIIQTIVGPRLEILDINARWPGSLSNAEVFSNSELHKKLERRKISGVILADVDHIQTTHVFTPVMQTFLDAEAKYNYAHAQTHLVTDRSFKVWTKRFPCLQTRMKTSHVLYVGNVVVACAVLHNMCVFLKDAHFGPQTIDKAFNHYNFKLYPIGECAKTSFIMKHFNK